MTMAYSNYFPAGYQPMQMYQQPMQQMTQQPQAQPQQNSTGLIWVQGEGAAKSYLVAPGNTVALFDNESQTIYIKSADASGMPSMRILDYTFRDTTPQNKPAHAESDFATKEDLLHLQAEIDALRAKYAVSEGSAE